MKKYLLPLSICVLVLFSCNRPHRKVHHSDFVTEVMVKTTPVKDQGPSALCWVYAMLATIESEHLMMGDSVNLSTDYIARALLEEQAMNYYLSQGHHPINLRGTMPMLIHFIEQYGELPFDSYDGKGTTNYTVIGRKLEKAARTSTSLQALKTKTQNILDHEIGYLPRFIFMLGAEYTPLEFAHSVCHPQEYIALTSFTHHPFWDRFALEIPDNKFHDPFLNIPLDTLMSTIDNALRKGHPVCWEGDISEPGFSFERGIALLNSPHANQQKRQKGFERFETTDDHCMELIGIAHNREGRKFYIAKNSWGTGNPYHGMMYLSEDYVRMKTIAIMVNRTCTQDLEKKQAQYRHDKNRPIGF